MKTFVKGHEITIEVVDVTPQMASDWLTYKNTKNRHMNKNHMKALVRNMKQGTWRFNGDTICFDWNGVLVDGQHRLSAIIEFGEPVKSIIVRGLDPETIKTKDIEMKPRNLGDLLQMDGVMNARMIAAGISKYFTMKDGRISITSLRSRGSNGGRTSQEFGTIESKYNFFYGHQDFIETITPIIRLWYEKFHILTTSDIYGMYLHLYIDNHHSTEEICGFFDRLCLNQNDNKMVNVLRQKLLDDAFSKYPMTSTYRQCYIAKAWNYYIKGKEVNVLSYNVEKEGMIEFI